MIELKLYLLRGSHCEQKNGEGMSGLWCLPQHLEEKIGR
jgi:hypothetical protein